MPDPTDPPTTRTPNICDNFNAEPGDPVEWQAIPPTGCIVSQNGANVWPFSPASPITLPTSNPITIKSALAAGSYAYNVSCCPFEAEFKVVTVAE